jgi:hypothetical protein
MLDSHVDAFYKILLEKNYSYFIPQDKELLLYDFYMLVHMSALDKEGRFEPGDKKDPYGQLTRTSTLSMGLSESTKFSFEEIKKQVIDYLQPELLESAFYAISCEIRHVFDINTIPEIVSKLNDSSDFFRNFQYNYQKLKSMQAFKRNTSGMQDIFDKRRRQFNKKYDIVKKEKNPSNLQYQMSYKAVKKTLKSINMSEIDFIRLAERSFNELTWNRSYGGKAWASICDAFQKLYYAKREVDQIIFIDNMYHQQHNTDTVFNKLQSYYKNGYSWILSALNFKADVRDTWDRVERIRKVTGNKIRNVDKMYIEMLKASGDKTWQQYYKIENKTDEQKKLEDEWLDDLGLTDSSSSLPSKLKQKYHNLAKEGIIKFNNHFKDGYVYMGTGDDKEKSIEQDLTTTIPDLISKYGYQGLYIEGAKGKMSDDAIYSGTDADGEYFLDVETWEKIFGSLPSKDKVATKDNSLEKFKEEFINYAKHGIRKMSNILGDRYVYIGKGSNKKSIREQLTTHFPHLHNNITGNIGKMFSTGSISMGYSGSTPNSDYVMDKTAWENIFGPLSDIITKKDKELLAKLEDDTSRKTLEDFKELGPSIFPKEPSIVNGNFIYTGRGKDVKNLLNSIKNNNLVSLLKIHYATRFKDWAVDPISYKDLEDDYYTCIALSDWNDLVHILKNSQVGDKKPKPPVSFDRIKEYGKILFTVSTGILTGSYVYVGLGKDSKKYITTLSPNYKTDKTYVVYQSELTGKLCEWKPVKTMDSIEDNYHICVDHKYWELYFKNKESNKKRELPETIEYYKKLAKEGKKKFNDSHVTNMNVVYVGHGQAVKTAIDHGILPYDTEDDKKAYGKWLTVGKWEPLTTLSDISFAYDVWMLNHQWVELFGPIADLKDKIDKKRVPASARAKFRKIAKEYLMAGKFYHNYKKQRLIYIGDGDILNADPDIPKILTSEYIYGASKVDDDNEIYLMNGMKGDNGGINYFTTEDKWEELFGPLPKIEDSQSQVVSDEYKEYMIMAAESGYESDYFELITKHGYIFIGNKGQEYLREILKRGAKIYAHNHSGLKVQPSDMFQIYDVFKYSHQNLFIKKRDWIKITGELPPPNLTF